jgi:hypothetical protein
MTIVKRRSVAMIDAAVEIVFQGRCSPRASTTTHNARCANVAVHPSRYAAPSIRPDKIGPVYGGGKRTACQSRWITARAVPVLGPPPTFRSSPLLTARRCCPRPHSPQLPAGSARPLSENGSTAVRPGGPGRSNRRSRLTSLLARRPTFVGPCMSGTFGGRQTTPDPIQVAGRERHGQTVDANHADGAKSFRGRFGDEVSRLRMEYSRIRVSARSTHRIERHPVTPPLIGTARCAVRCYGSNHASASVDDRANLPQLALAQ